MLGILHRIEEVERHVAATARGAQADRAAEERLYYDIIELTILDYARL